MHAACTIEGAVIHCCSVLCVLGRIDYVAACKEMRSILDVSYR